MSRRRGGDGMSTGVLIALVVIATLLCAALVVVMYMDKKGMLGGGIPDVAVTNEAGEEAGAADNGQDADTTVITEDQLQASNGSSLIPDNKDVDIAALRTKNPDIYAWLYIPEAGIDEPVLQNSEDINYYVTHNADGQSDENGAVFT
nr:hypothetical protein [Lachnospiraceae bacterium]